MLYLKRLEGILFYLVIFSISLQLGKHFWPLFSFIDGIRLDYLSPTLYLSDIFIIAFILIHLLFSYKSFFSFISKSFVLPFFLASILISSFLAANFDASIYWSLKVIEMTLLGWAISNYVFRPGQFSKVIDVIVFAAVIQSMIAIFQFILQRSIGGPFYFLGERSFDVSTIGISTFFSSGQEFLRPYGTFPHPNVLAIFLSVALLLSTYFIFRARNQARSYIYSFASMFVLLGLLATVSRVIIFLSLTFLLFAFIKSKKHLFYATTVLLILLPVYLLIFSGRFLTLGPIVEAITVRMQMIGVNILLLKDNLFFGLGLNNTFYGTIPNTLPIYARFQPVHNIYLQILLQVGLVGAVPVLVFLVKVIKRIYVARKNKYPLFVVGLLSAEILILGFMDHFPVTLQQGMFITTFLLGLLFNKSIEQELE